MADVVHANTKVRAPSGKAGEATLECGAPRPGALLTGDPKRITCPNCKGK